MVVFSNIARSRWAPKLNHRQKRGNNDEQSAAVWLSGWSTGYQGGVNPPPGAPTGKTKVLNLDYNVAGMLSYLPICCINLVFSIIWLASEPKENRILRFHALQSLLLIGLFFIVNVIFWILTIAVAVTP